MIRVEIIFHQVLLHYEIARERDLGKYNYESGLDSPNTCGSDDVLESLIACAFIELDTPAQPHDEKENDE